MKNFVVMVVLLLCTQLVGAQPHEAELELATRHILRPAEISELESKLDGLKGSSSDEEVWARALVDKIVRDRGSLEYLYHDLAKLVGPKELTRLRTALDGLARALGSARVEGSPAQVLSRHRSMLNRIHLAWDEAVKVVEPRRTQWEERFQHLVKADSPSPEARKFLGVYARTRLYYHYLDGSLGELLKQS